MQRVLVINGPNLNLLGRREPEVYGTTTLAELERTITGWGDDLGLTVAVYQSNHEGAIIDRIQAAAYGDAADRAEAIVLNGGAYTHYSYAIHDALLAADLPAVEVHISNIKRREPWRRTSVTAAACVYEIHGRGIEGYRWALRHLTARAAIPPETIAYGPDDDQVGDLRLPDGAGPHPVAVVVHGGFWADPWTRDTMDHLAVDLTRRGFATWNVEYRRVGTGGGWPLTDDDVGAAIDHVGVLAGAHPLDLDRVVLLGHSAGGQLVLAAAGGFGTARVEAVVALAPIADLAEGHRLGLDGGAVESYLRRTPDDGPERYRTASPIEIGAPAARTIVFHGDADDRVPVDLSRRYAAAHDVDYVETAGVDHFEWLDPETAAWQSVVAALLGTDPG